jgi:hypothetical protein
MEGLCGSNSSKCVPRMETGIGRLLGRDTEEISRNRELADDP